MFGYTDGQEEVRYQLDIVHEGKWPLWLHKEECLFHGSTDTRAYTMPVLPFRPGDSFQFSLPLLSLASPLLLHPPLFHPPVALKLPPASQIREYSRTLGK